MTFAQNSAVRAVNGPVPVTNTAEAERLIEHLLDVMDSLLTIVEDETRLVRAGRLGAAAKLAQAKTELSTLYTADTARISVSQPLLARALPEVLAALRKRHDLFRAVLQMNLTVLATAHAVSEGIMRGVSDSLARKATPQGYGASGRSAAPALSSQQPLTLSRVL